MKNRSMSYSKSISKNVKNIPSRSPRDSRSSHHHTKTQKTHSSYSVLTPTVYDPLFESLEAEQPQVLAERAGWVVVHKPAGWLTHPDGREGIDRRLDLFTWTQEKLKRSLGVHQRLDVSTSGLIAFSTTSAGAKIVESSLKRPEAKRYLAVVEGFPTQQRGEINKAVHTTPHKEAVTRYQVINQGSSWSLLEVLPLTGRTHQIRIHCESLGCPIRGDIRYGDSFDLRAPRALLHAYQLTINYEQFTAPLPADFARYQVGNTSEEKRKAANLTRSEIQQGDETDCYRLFNGAPEGFEGWRLDRYGDWLWLIHDQGSPFGPLPYNESRGIYRLEALIDRSSGQQSAPLLWKGEQAPQPLTVSEAGVRYAVELGDQLSTGLFLDQRPQRAWLAKSKRPWGRVLNTFAHAGGFSIAASVAGAETVSIDLSTKWLDRIPYQLELNDLDPRSHRQLTGDVFDWLRRLQKRGERFDLIILDPPSTSVGKKKKRWSAAKDYPELVSLALPLLNPGGRILTCTNSRKLTPYKFARSLSEVMPKAEGYRLERVCAPGVDFPTDQSLAVKNLVWRAPN